MVIIGHCSRRSIPAQPFDIDHRAPDERCQTIITINMNDIRYALNIPPVGRSLARPLMTHSCHNEHQLEGYNKTRLLRRASQSVLEWMRACHRALPAQQETDKFKTISIHSSLPDQNQKQDFGGVFSLARSLFAQWTTHVPCGWVHQQWLNLDPKHSHGFTRSGLKRKKPQKRLHNSITQKKQGNQVLLDPYFGEREPRTKQMNKTKPFT